MQSEIDEIRKVFGQNNGEEIVTFDKLPQAGSERHYYRIGTKERTYIATYGANVPENEAFIYFSAHFQKKDLPTAKIFYISGDKKIYIQDDFGDVSLLDHLESKGFTEEVYALYKQSLEK